MKTALVSTLAAAGACLSIAFSAPALAAEKYPAAKMAAPAPVAAAFALTPKEQKFFADRANQLVQTGFRKMDMDVVKSFYHPDAGTRFADADGPFHKGWEEYSAWLGKIFHKLAVKQNFELREFYSYKVGSGAVVSTMIIDNRTRLSNGQDIDSAMRLSLVWGKKDGKWLVVHEHFSLWHGELANLLGYKDEGRKQLTID